MIFKDRKIFAVLMAVIVAVALTFTVTSSPVPAYADDEEYDESSAIEINCTTYPYTPFYKSSNKAYKITKGEGAAAWGKIDKDWKLVFNIEAADPYEVWEPVILKKGDGDFTFATKTMTLTLKGEKILPRVTKLHPDTKYFYVNINVSAVDIKTGDILAEAETQAYAFTPITEYTFEKDRITMVGDTGIIPHLNDVYVANYKYPDGALLTYTVNDITSSDRNIVSLAKSGSDWIYCAENPGTAVMTVTYTNRSGDKKSYTFNIKVSLDAYAVTIDPVDEVMTLPAPYGDGVTLSAYATHITQEGKERVPLTELPEDISYEWNIEDTNNDHFDIEYFDDGSIHVTFDEDAEDYDSVDLVLSLCRDGDMICSDNVTPYCTYLYSIMGADTLDPMPQIGESTVIPLDITEYSLFHPDGIKIEPMETLFHYDHNALSVDEETLTITRLTGEPTFIIVSAEWRSDEEIGKNNITYDIPAAPADLSEWDVMIGEDRASDWPEIAIDAQDRITFDDLDISVCCDDVALHTDKYDLTAYYYDKETGTKEAITSGDFALEYNVKDQNAGYCDFIIQAVPSQGSPHKGKTADYVGFTLCDQSSLSRLNSVVSFDSEYEAENVRNWHPYYRIPAESAPASGPEVKDVNGNVLAEGTDYDITYYHRDDAYSQVDPLPGLPSEAGHYFGVITGKGNYSGESYIDFDIGKANPMTAAGKTKTIKKKKLKKKARTISGAVAVNDAQGPLTYSVYDGSAKSLKALTVSETTGKVTVRKKTKKGTYKIQVLVSDEGNEEYFAVSHIVTVTVKVK